MCYVDVILHAVNELHVLEDAESGILRLCIYLGVKQCELVLPDEVEACGLSPCRDIGASIECVKRHLELKGLLC